MISIKKYMEEADISPPAAPGTTPEEMLRVAQEVLAMLLTAMGEAAVRAFPPTGGELRPALDKLREEVDASSTAPQREHGERARQELQNWAENTLQQLEHKADEVRELLLVLAKAGEEVAERDQRYTSQFEAITEQLKKASLMENFAQVRAVVMRSAAALKRSSEQMASDGAQSVKAMRAQIESYRNRLEEAERAATTDQLTGLCNRAYLEEAVARSIAQDTPFCLVMLDLNGFKQVNDRYGHSAGDDLLKQFAVELKQVARSDDLACRWGGDEFVLLIRAGEAQTEQFVHRIREWTVGEYTLMQSGEGVTVQLDFAWGIAEYRPEESAAALLSRADEAMYRTKKSATQTQR